MHAQDILPTKADFDLLPLNFTDITSLPNVSLWEKIESLGSRTDFRTEWGEWEAIRELIQNAVDASPKIKLLYEDQQDISYVIDNGKGIVKSDLLYGETKRKTEYGIHCLRGTYGEGLKIGIIALMRMGYKIVIRTVNFDYQFSIENSVDYRGHGTEQERIEYQQLHWFRKPNQVTRGTTIAILGINCLKYRKRFSTFIIEDHPETLLLSVKIDPEIVIEAKKEIVEYSKKIEELKQKSPETDKTYIEMYQKMVGEKEGIVLEECKVRQILDLQPPIAPSGMIYVRDIFVTRLPAYFSYNFWFNDTKDALPPNRNEFKNFWPLKQEMELLLRGSPPEVLNKLFKNIYYDIQPLGFPEDKRFLRSEALEWKTLNLNELRSLGKEEALNLYTTLLGFVMEKGKTDFGWSRDSQEQKLLEHHGIEDLRDQFPDIRNVLIRYNLIRDPMDIARGTDLLNQTIIVTPEEIASSTLENREELSVALKKLKEQLECIISEIKYGDIGSPTLHFYGGNFKSEDEDVGGYYKRDTNQILIHIENLGNYENVLRVLIHELAHASGEECKDVTAPFISALQTIASRVFTMIRKGRCDFEEIATSSSVIDDYEKQLENYVLEKSIKIASPKGIIRPPDFERSPDDKTKIDNTMSKISQNAYADYDDVKIILLGYTSSGTYNPREWNSRGRDAYRGRSWETNKKEPLSNEEIFSKDIETLIKLGLSIPIAAQRRTIDPEKWKDLINHPLSAGVKLEPDYLIPGEDWSNPETMIEFILNHPQPHIKARNFTALINFINPWKLLEQRLEDYLRFQAKENIENISEISAEIQDPMRKAYLSGLYADQEWLGKLRRIAPKIVNLQHPAEEDIGYDVYYYPLKEKLMEKANQYNWLEILQLFEKVKSPQLRSTLVDIYAERAKQDSKFLNKILEMEKPENNPAVLRHIIQALSESSSYAPLDGSAGLPPAKFIEFMKGRLPVYRDIIRSNKERALDNHSLYEVDEFERILNLYEERWARTQRNKRRDEESRSRRRYR